jgi:hypothetical protein
MDNKNFPTPSKTTSFPEFEDFEKQEMELQQKMNDLNKKLKKI